MEEQIEAEKVEVAPCCNDQDEEIKTNDDGTLEEVYRDKRTGNIVTHPSLRNKDQSNSRRDRCWELYIKSVRDGRPSAMQAAKDAGFSDNTAINIKKMRWFKDKEDKLRRSKMMTNAEKNIARLLNLGLTRIKKLEDGTTEEVFDAEKARIVADMSKLIVTTLGKDDGWSTKSELKVTTLPTPILSLDAMDITPQLEEPNEEVE